MSRWFRSAKAPPTMVGADEEQHLRDVEHAMLKLLNDDIAEADKILRLQDSSYHHLGRGISGFISAMLGVEKELLKEASLVLLEAENKSWEDMKKAQKEPAAFQSSIYPPGTEYLLCYCVAQLTSAITGVLSGSITEAVRGFYKLRKAYLTLNGILDLETKYLEKLAKSSTVSLASGQVTPAKLTAEDMAHPTDDKENGEDSDGAFVNVSRPPSLISPTNPPDIDEELTAKAFTTHTDIFIHSGTATCCGLLLLIFSMIENPIFNKILYIVGFKGDRERGTKLLWQGTRYSNFNSAIAALSLLGFYNGLVGFCDILATDAAANDDICGYPKDKCKALLSQMRSRYPDSGLWKMQEAQMLSYNKNLKGAVAILEENARSEIKQITMINTFELALTTLFLHDYLASTEAWVKCSELSSWSPSLYAYLAGCSYLELYRDTRISDPKKASTYKEKAMKFLLAAPPLAGKQKVMAKQLPFDIYIVAKVAKWEQRAKSWGVDLADAIGPSPYVEMIFFWNGVKKSGPEELERSLECLKEERMTNPEKCLEDEDDGTIQLLLKACMLRNLGRWNESRELLTKEIVESEKYRARGALRDDWTLPAAYYELACINWHEKDAPPKDLTEEEQKEYRKKKVLECAEILEKVHTWPQTYVFEARMGFKISTSLMTVKREKALLGI